MNHRFNDIQSLCNIHLKQKVPSVSVKNTSYYIWRLEIAEDDSKGMDVMKTIHKINTKFLNTWLR